MLRYKPTAVVGASTGLFGAVWAQAEVRKVMKASGAHVLESELPVGMADYAFVEGEDALADPELTQRLKDLLGDLVREVSEPRRSVVIELPLIQPDDGPKERADAARNRARILEAAGALVAEQGIERVSMDDVARAACVGTGTLYRRFGDRAGLAFALLDEQTRDFQNALISGPPPLGPGAPARERLKAFGAGYLELLETHAALMVAAAPGGKEAEGPTSLYTTHLAILLREAAPLRRSAVHRGGAAGDASPRRTTCACATGWAGRVERLREGWDALVDAIALAVRRTRGAEAHHDARLAGDGAERVMEAGGHDGLAARAQQMLLAVEAQLRDAVDHAQQRVLERLKAERSLVREGLEVELGAVADGGGGGDQGSHCRRSSPGRPHGGYGADSPPVVRLSEGRHHPLRDQLELAVDVRHVRARPRR